MKLACVERPSEIRLADVASLAESDEDKLTGMEKTADVELVAESRCGGIIGDTEHLLMG